MTDVAAVAGFAGRVCSVEATPLIDWEGVDVDGRAEGAVVLAADAAGSAAADVGSVAVGAGDVGGGCGVGVGPAHGLEPDP
jgi:hypothetical protein